MLGRIAVMAASIALVAGCAGMEPAGRNAQRSPAPAPVTRQSPTPPPPAATLPPPQPSAPTQAAPPPARLEAPPPSSTAPTLAAPAPSTTTRTITPSTPAAPPLSDVSDVADLDDDSIVVPGQRDVQVPPPGGDPRSNAERREDVRAWDRCVIGVQSAYESDPMRPQLTSPEEYCRESLGMSNRTAVPDSRRQR